METWLPFGVGLVLLCVGGDLLVRGAVRLADRLGISPLVIGLTLVGFGTSTPELVTSVQAALSGAPGIAYGNIVGSNIANILLILGISALICPIAVTPMALRRDAGVMLAAALLFAGLALAGPLGRVAGLGFLLLLVAYLVLAVWQERRAAPAPAAPTDLPARGHPARDIALTLAGLAATLAGGTLLVRGAIGIAAALELPETLVGLTIVAVGTSLPELVTSVVASLRRQTDVAFGNIVGSNIYNVLAIGGATATLSPGAVPSRIASFDNLLMIGASVLLVLVSATRLRIERWEGGLLLAGYVGYLGLIRP
ncbi:calcium/sodium antiporter [Mesobacterium pallidum]|uniref:calcium/sodium antiporter n=1 Tax=Mesobacterium pallidum TaxID=2872037 RepID=UPI001EE175E1|nr:calcium/sodium antiporter [Mesobacterium pallidum]